MLPYQQRFIELALHVGALKFGDFTLKSGRKSPYFFDMGAFCTGSALKLVGEAFAACINQEKFDYQQLFGPAYKGIPLVCTTAIALSATVDRGFCFNRKESKQHGEGGTIVGMPPGHSILLLDDVLTAGTAVSAVIQQLGATNIAGLVIALDRCEPVAEHPTALQYIASHFNIPVASIVTIYDVLDTLQARQDPAFDKVASHMEHFTKAPTGS